MDFLDPEEVCCGPAEKSPLQTKTLTQVDHEKSYPNRVAQCERIEKLESQMNRLVQDVEMIKNQQCETAGAIQRALERGVCSLGGRFKLVNEICGISYGCDSKIDGSSRSSCRSSSSTTSTNPEINGPKENTKNEKGDKNKCTEFVIG